MSGGAIACGLAVIINSGATLDVTHWAHLHQTHAYCIRTNECSTQQILQLSEAKVCEFQHIKQLVQLPNLWGINPEVQGDRRVVNLNQPPVTVEQLRANPRPSALVIEGQLPTQ